MNAYNSTMFRYIQTYLAILMSFDCVDTKMWDRREVQYQCKEIQVQQKYYVKLSKA